MGNFGPNDGLAVCKRDLFGCGQCVSGEIRLRLVSRIERMSASVQSGRCVLLSTKMFRAGSFDSPKVGSWVLRRSIRNN